jgi:hypothetical protein
MRKILMFLIACVAVSFTASATPSWEINSKGAIQWNVDKAQLPHKDHVEMSGEQMAFVLRWAINADGVLDLDRSLVFPMLRTIPNDTHASLMHRLNTDITSMVSVEEKSLYNEATKFVEIDGMFRVVSIFDEAVEVERIIFPSMDKPFMCERYVLKNLQDDEVKVYIPEFKQNITTLPECGVDGSYLISASIQGAGTYKLKSGESLTFDAVFQACRLTEAPQVADVDAEYAARRAFVENDIDSALILATPDQVVNTMFRYAKIRASESIFKTSGGYMHAPGGESYYAAIWANDQAEYVNPFFPYLGYAVGNESAMNSFRHFARFMNDEWKPIPSSIIAEGKDIWNGAGDRGDAAMIAYGASRYALAMGDKTVAKELWPLIEWCLEYCDRKLNDGGVVTSDTDELENRFPSGEANLCTSSLYYDALLSSAYLASELAMNPSVAKDYRKKAETLRRNIDSYFAKEMYGYDTYQYYDGNDLLRSWICIPLTVGIMDRAEGTIEALFSEYLWHKDGLLTQQGTSTYWDRSTLYGLRGVYAAGASDLATEKLKYYSHRRLLEDHVPYAIEAWPEGSQRHLSAESGLYCRVLTEGLFGIRPTGLRSFELKPSLPSEWDAISLYNIKAFGSDFSLNVTRREDGKLEITVTPAGGAVKKYLIRNGQSLKVNL